MGINTDHHVVYVNIASTDTLYYKVDQTLEICGARVQSLGGAVVGELPVPWDTETGSF